MTTATTDANGAYSLAGVVDQAAAYRVRALADPVHLESYSPILSITLAGPTTTVATQSVPSVLAGGSVTFAGAVTTAAGPSVGQTVSLARALPGSTDWVRVATAVTDADGAYSLDATVDQAAAYRVRALVDADHLESYSASMDVALIQPTTTTVTPSAPGAYAGRTVTFAGSVATADSTATPVAGRTVALARRLPGTSSWVRLSTAVTDEAGAFTVPVVVDQSAAYRVRALGDAIYASSTSPTQSVALIPPATTALDIKANTSVIRRGKPVTLYGHLRTVDSAGHTTGLGSRWVSLWRRPAGSTTWKKVAGYRTLSTGWWAIPTTPWKTATYQVPLLRWRGVRRDAVALAGAEAGSEAGRPSGRALAGRPTGAERGGGSRTTRVHVRRHPSPQRLPRKQRPEPRAARPSRSPGPKSSKPLFSAFISSPGSRTWSRPTRWPSSCSTTAFTSARPCGIRSIRVSPGVSSATTPVTKTASLPESVRHRGAAADADDPAAQRGDPVRCRPRHQAGAARGAAADDAGAHPVVGLPVGAAVDHDPQPGGRRDLVDGLTHDALAAGGRERVVDLEVHLAARVVGHRHVLAARLVLDEGEAAEPVRDDRRPTQGNAAVQAVEAHRDAELAVGDDQPDRGHHRNSGKRRAGASTSWRGRRCGRKPMASSGSRSSSASRRIIRRRRRAGPSSTCRASSPVARRR